MSQNFFLFCFCFLSCCVNGALPVIRWNVIYLLQMNCIMCEKGYNYGLNLSAVFQLFHINLLSSYNRQLTIKKKMVDIFGDVKYNSQTL